MNVVDSSGWLEYFAGTERLKFFAKAIEDTEKLIVPTITLAEVFKKVYKEANEHDALKAIAHMKQGKVVDLDSHISLAAAKLGLEHKLPLVDSILLATANRHKATLWTQDSDFAEIAHVQFFPKRMKK